MRKYIRHMFLGNYDMQVKKERRAVIAIWSLTIMWMNALYHLIREMDRTEGVREMPEALIELDMQDMRQLRVLDPELYVMLIEYLMEVDGEEYTHADIVALYNELEG